MERLGLLTIAAKSDPARASEILEINIQEGEIQESVATPTSKPTDNPDVGEGDLNPTPTSSVDDPAGEGSEVSDVITFSHFIIGMIGVIISGGYGYALIHREDRSQITKMRCILAPVVGSLAGYNYVALGLPGSAALLLSLNMYAGLCVALAGGFLALILTRIVCSRI